MESVTTNEKIDEIILILRGVQSQTLQHTEDFEKLEKRLMVFEKSIEFINTQYENQRKITKTILNKNTKLETENEVLKKQVGKLQAEINRVHNKVNDLEQYDCRDCVKINGIPKEENEKTESLVIKLGEKLGVKCAATEIQACHRVGPKNDATIICKFGNRKLRDAFMQIFFLL